ncbi:LuxR C-terminal-related transcriptional regulator [Streptomyces sp. XD-27]|uniref:helix-turn-helix transcriptional regulator n=1 Tax=Streptomyces sp. XD-27 TaxID=3062779 RepID=UPI0026F46CC3|nr:LuxR C-terminal-related transcriptional regulator [Streptomyces sp. XD-27]WKX69259.1 LuxR C-terminal-related transcriptional regulator [Streptomyces sp. XD-27]
MLKEPTLEIRELRERTRLDQQTFSEATRLLREVGLLADAGPDRLATVSTEKALARLACMAEESADMWLADSVRLRKAIRLLCTELADQYHDQTSLAPAELIVGMDRISECLEDSAEIAVNEVLSMHPGPVIESRTPDRIARNQRVLKRGVAMRTIHLASTSRVPNGLRYLRELQGMGAAIRLAPTIPFRLIVIDDVMAFTPAPGNEAQAAALVTRGPIITHLLRRVFEHCWHSATALDSAAPDGPGEHAPPLDTQQFTVLQMLNAGLKDEAIARELGVSIRTLRRITADLMDKLGATSRFQAGVRAQELGWLASDGGSGSGYRREHPEADVDGPDHERLPAQEPGAAAEPGAQ